MDRKVVYLVNPKAGTGLKSSLVKAINRVHQNRHIHFEILETNPAGDYGFLVQRITEESISDIIVCGGDGSVNAVAASMIGVDVNIGIIPLGSGNGLAFTAGIPKALSKSLQLVFEGKPSYVDGFFINDAFSCMLCGIGFDAQVAHDFALEKTRGLQTYIRKSVINFFAAKAYPFVIDYPGGSMKTDAYFISVANSNQFGNHVTIAPHASLSDGLLDIVIVKKMSKLLLPFTLLRHITGINGKPQRSDLENKNNIIYFQTTTLTISNPGLAPLHIDGEPANTAKQFTVRVQPQALKLIQPALP